MTAIKFLAAERELRKHSKNSDKSCF